MSKPVDRIITDNITPAPSLCPDSSSSHHSHESSTPEPSVAPASSTPAAHTFKDQQSNNLPHRRLMIVFPVLALAQFTAYLDQTSITAAVPAIGDALHLGPSLPWVATAYLLATTAIQLINGRISDIFGRKRTLLLSLALLAIGNLVTGFAKTPAVLFTFRTVSGLGGGAITALVMITASDVTTLKQRGKYNGFIGAAVAFGSGTGPLIGGAIAGHVSWRWTLWYDIPWLVVLTILLYVVLPDMPGSGNTKSKMRMVDWPGLFISVVAIVLLVIPLSRGGSSIPWDSTQVIAMLVVGAVILVVFLAIEWKYASLPIMPLHLFTSDLSCNILLIQNTLFGFVYWANLFYMPIYLQNVRGYSSTVAGAIIMPMAGAQGIGSIVSGLIISHTGHYNPIMIAAQALWTAGLIAQAFYSATTPIWAICVVGFFQGLGTGCCFQPSLVALLAHSRRADRAVLNSLRNSLRTMGGVLGLTVSGAILNNVLQRRLRDVVSPGIAAQLATSAHSLNEMGLTSQQTASVLKAYMQGMRYIFIMYAPIMGICALGALLIKDRGLAEKDTSATLHAQRRQKNNAVDPKDQAPSSVPLAVVTNTATIPGPNCKDCRQ